MRNERRTDSDVDADADPTAVTSCTMHIHNFMHHPPSLNQLFQPLLVQAPACLSIHTIHIIPYSPHTSPSISDHMLDTNVVKHSTLEVLTTSGPVPLGNMIISQRLSDYHSTHSRFELRPVPCIGCPDHIFFFFLSTLHF